MAEQAEILYYGYSSYKFRQRMKKIFNLLLLSLFVFSLSSCQHVQGEYVILRKGISPFFCLFAAEEELKYFVYCDVCGKDERVRFQVSKEYFNNVSRGDTIIVDGYYRVREINRIGRWYNLSNSGY